MRVIAIMVLAAYGMTLAAGLAFAETKRAGREAIQVAAETPAQPAADQPEGPPPKVVAVDTNKDGKPDRWEHYQGNEVSKIESDTNQDGTLDEWATFDKGKVVKVEKDTDFDGKPDRWVDY